MRDDEKNEKKWLVMEMERAKERQSQLPRWAVPAPGKRKRHLRLIQGGKSE